VKQQSTQTPPAEGSSSCTCISGTAWILLILLFAPVISWLVKTWTVSMYDAHGALAPFLAGGMIFARRRTLATLPCAPDARGLWLVGASIVILLTALLMNFNMLGGAALIVALAGMIWTLCGAAVLRSLTFPIAFLLLMLPLNYPLEVVLGFRLRFLATQLSTLFISWVGIPVEVQGTVISTPHFTVAIESPCSGLKTLSALMLAGMTQAYFLHKRWWERGAILLLVPPVALLVNAMRNTAIVLIGHYYGESAAMGWLHGFSGVMTFLLAMIILIIFSEVLLWRQKSTSA